MFCSQCGTNNKDEATFCINCGAAISNQAAQQPQQPIQQPVQQQPVQPVQPVMQPQQPGQPVMQPPYGAQPGYGAQPNMQQPYGAQPGYGAQPNMQQPYGAQPGYGGQPYMQHPMQMTRKKSPIGLIIGLASLVVVVAVVLLIIFVGGKNFASNLTPEGPVNMIVKAMNNADAELYLKAFPEKIADSYGTVDSVETLLETMKENMDSQYGDNTKISIDIGKKTKITGDDLDELKEICEESDVTITAAYDIELTMTYKGADDKETEDGSVTVVKVDGKWYIYSLE